MILYIQLENLRKAILIDFCDTTVFSAFNKLETNLDGIADAINETGDIIDVYMTVIKSVLSSRNPSK